MTKIICVVDNAVKEGTGLQSEHGLSFWIETAYGNVLLDTGQTAAVLSHNLDVLGLSPREVDKLALSHAHYDHTGGLDAVLSKNTALTLFAHPDVFRPRYSLRKGEYQSIGLSLSGEALAARADLSLGDAPAEILLGLWTTGEILERTEPEGRSPHHFIHTGKGWEPDPYRDDMSLVLKTNEGLVVICGCCHAGILNTLFHVERNFEGPIATVIGGTHLASADDPYLSHVIDVFNGRFRNLSLYLNHCTGKNAFERLAGAFGSRVTACPAGTVIDFNP